MKKNYLIIFFICLCTLQFSAQVTINGSTGIILDGNLVGIALTGNATSSGVITSITLDLNISHTWNGDLTVTLISPSATSVVLIDRPGRPVPSAFGCNNDGMMITLIDGGAGDIEVCAPPGPANGITGPYNPSNPLATFIGEEVNGTWTLLVTDNSSGDGGTVDLWTLNIEATPLSLNEYSIESFIYSPNPVKNNLSLRAEKTIEHIFVLNMLGQEVLRTTPNSLSNELDMSPLKSGTYFVKVSINDTIETIRVVKQ